MKKFLIAMLLFAALPVAALAQSPSMMSMAQSELQKRGLNETEVRARLLENGIDVDNIPPTEYASYQGRVIAILDQMQAEKAKKSEPAKKTVPELTTDNNSSESSAGATAVTPSGGGETTVTASSATMPQTSIGEAAAEAALEETLTENHISTTAGDDIYGHSLFTGTSMDVFRTTDGAQAPDTYVLGEGDEIHISIFGSSQTEIHQRIGADGSIQPAGAAKIFLKGMTLAQGRVAIQNKLAQHYAYRSDQIAVTITTARTVTVSIYGEVGVQGGFTLSALNTAFNALAAAGGPTSIGSIRNIQRSRGGKTDRLDLYQYMVGNSKNMLFDLQNGDVLFVPVANNIVRIEGAVRRPMRYEMIEGESLKDLIGYAGGLTYDVYPDFVQIERRQNDELKYLEYNLDDIMSGKTKVVVEGGDVIRIKTSNRPMENFVSIRGDVYYGGNFDFEQNSSLLALIEKAQLKYTARKDYIIVERTSPDETVEFLTIPFPGENGNPDFKLQARDVVTVLAQDSYLEKWTISVSGEVRNPFSRTFGLNDQMTLGQAIEYAGGPTHTARTDYVYIERTRPDLTVEVLTLPFPTDDTDAANFKLQAKDVVRVLSLASFRDVDQITVNGQVREPFTRTFGLNDRMTVNQAIEYAHGLKQSVFPVAYIVRRDLTNPVKRQYIRVNLENDGETLLQPGDVLTIYDNTTYTNVGEVRVSGAVKNPVTTTYDPSITLHDLLMMAGGFEVGAAYDRVEVFRLVIDKKNEAQLELLTLKVDDNYNIIEDPKDKKAPKNFQLQPFDHIVVRMTPNWTKGRYVEVNGRVKYPGVYVLEDNETQLWEIIKKAGGLLDDADPYSTLFRTTGRFRGMIGINLDEISHRKGNLKNPILMDGDVITIPRRENTVVIRAVGTRMNQYVPADFTADQKTISYQGSHSAEWYIKHFAGGYDEDADKWSVTVTYPNNQSEGTGHCLFFFRSTPTVEPGGVITLRMDTEKIRERERELVEPKEKFDLGAELGKILTTLTSLGSIIIMAYSISKLNNN